MALVKKMSKSGKVVKRPSSPKKSTGTGQFGPRPLGVVMHGPPGVGKTSFWANHKNIAFVHDPAEPGILDLLAYNEVPEPQQIIQVDTFNELVDVRLESGIDLVAFDSLTGIEKLCFTQHCEEYFDGDWSNKGFYSYQQGPRNAAKTDWPRFLESLDAHRNKGVNVVILAHTTIRMEPNPDGPDYQRYVPAADKAIWEITSRWAQATFFYNYYVEPKKDKGETRRKVDAQEDRRFIYTRYSPAWEAKNRYGLESEIDATGSASQAYASFVKAFGKALTNPVHHRIVKGDS